MTAFDTAWNVMKGNYITVRPIPYRPVNHLFRTVIPAGTTVVEATNLPSGIEEGKRYWAEPWDNMTDEEDSWHRNYGFLLTEEELAYGMADTSFDDFSLEGME